MMSTLYKAVFATTLLLVTTTRAEQINKTIVAEEKLDNYLQPPLNNFQANEQSSFFSRLANWFYPYGGTASPPVSNLQLTSPSCNPCDQQPWIPILGKHGQSDVINFVSPSQVPVSSNYGPPHQNQPQINPSYTHTDQFGYASNIKPQIVKPQSNHQYRTLTDKLMPPPFDPFRTSIPPLYNIKYPPKKVPLYDPYNKRPYYNFPNKGVVQYIPPSTSYGIPISPYRPLNNIRGHQQPPLGPIPLPALSLTPLLPVHNHRPFKPDAVVQNTNDIHSDNFAEHSAAIENRPGTHEVNIVPSIQVASYLASVEHPINYIESPLVDVTAIESKPSEPEISTTTTRTSLPEYLGEPHLNPEGFPTVTETFPQPYQSLNINPIIVPDDDSHAAASSTNETYQTLGHSRAPSYSTLTTSMLPPPVQEISWFSTYPTATTTKKPQQIQIIIPYTTRNQLPASESNRESKKHEYLSPPPPESINPWPLVYTVPPNEDPPVWTQFLDHNEQESKQITATAPTEKPSYTGSINNLGDVIVTKEPYDLVRLQKNIDVWTETEFNKNDLSVSSEGTSKLVPSKNIPLEFIPTTEPIQTTTTSFDPVSTNDLDSGSLENFLTSVLVNKTTTISPKANGNKVNIKIPPIVQAMLEKLHISYSPVTEKVYVVTPHSVWKNFTPEEINDKLQKIAHYANIPFPLPKFSVVLQPQGGNNKTETKDIVKEEKNGLQVVYSEWPHLINNLMTTTTTPKSTRPLDDETQTRKQTLKPTLKPHPLFGKMDLSSHTPPPNSSVEIYSGHSKVLTVITPASVNRRKKATSG